MVVDVQSQKTVSAYFTSKQILPFGSVLSGRKDNLPAGFSNCLFLKESKVFLLCARGEVGLTDA